MCPAPTLASIQERKKKNPSLKKAHITRSLTVKGLLTCSFSTFILSSSAFKLEMEAEKQEY